MKESTGFFCNAQIVDIPLYGTVKPFTKLLAIETKYPFQAKVLLQNNFSNSVNNYLNQLQEKFTDLKILFVKRANNPVNQFKIFTFKYDERLEEECFTLSNPNEIINLNLEKWFSSPQKPQTAKTQNRIFVCTNGKRDKCCAKFGLPIYNQLQKNTNWDVWESSHIGGHRMAPTLITLPNMVFYGGIHLSVLNDFTAHLQENKIYLKGLRGRAHHPKIFQAAEFHLRNQLQLLNNDIVIQFKLSNQQENHITITASIEQKQYLLQLIHQTKSDKIYSSCDQSKMENINYYDLLNCKQIA